MSRGPSYGAIKDLYPDHFVYWHWLHDRAKTVGTDLSRDPSGFLEFVEEIGPIPEFMIKPTVGRKDHSIGYVHGNYSWQEGRDNVLESSTRNLVVLRPEVRAKNSTAKRLACLEGRCSHPPHQSRRTA